MNMDFQGMKFAICNEIFQGWRIEEAMKFARDVGYDGIEIAPFTLARNVAEIDAKSRQQIRAAAAREGLEITGIHWVLVQTEGMHLNHPDKAVRMRTSRYLCDLVNFCGDLGGRILVFGSPKQRMALDGVSMQQAWEWAAETFRDAVKSAEERDVTICFEPLSPAETNFINTAAEAVRFARQFQSPAMKIILDVKAMCSEEKPVTQIIRDSAGEFAYFHANDANLKGPGFGNVDFVPIAEALKEVGYSGCLSVEVFKFDEGPVVIATQSLQYLRRVFKQAGCL